MSKNAMATLRDNLKTALETASKSLPQTGGRTISLKGKRFTLPNGASTSDPIKIVILDYRNVNRDYEATYDPKNPVPPRCFAINMDASAMAPHAEAPDPQSDMCEGCPQNEWGSAPTGSGKHCRNGVRLAVVPSDATEKTPVWELYVAPTTLKAWGSYLADFIARGHLPIEFTTSLSFDPGEDYPKLLFKSNGEVSEDALGIMAGLRERAQPILDAPLVAQEG